MQSADRVTVVGAGAFGTTLAAVASANGPVTLWALEPVVAECIRTTRENAVYLPGFALPEALDATSDLDAALAGADIVVLAVPARHMSSVVTSGAGAVSVGALIVSATKGIEAHSGRRMSELISVLLPDHPAERIGVLAGPNLAHEVMAGHPSATCVAFVEPEHADRVQRRLQSDRFRIDVTTDVTGCEVGGAVKNVVAIAAGLVDGLQYGMNTKAVVLSRGLAELTRLGTAMGGEASTFLGLAGAGDVLATCVSRHSRNRTLGEGLARGWTLAELQASTPGHAEGVDAVEPLLRLGASVGVELPVCATVGDVLAGAITPREGVVRLVGVQGVSASSSSWS